MLIPPNPNYSIKMPAWPLLYFCLDECLSVKLLEGPSYESLLDGKIKIWVHT